MTIKAETTTNITIDGSVLIRTVTNYYTGEVVAMDPDWIALRDAAWVASTGRFGEALATGVLSEVEPYPDGEVVLVARGAVVDVSPWSHALPREVVE